MIDIQMSVTWFVLLSTLLFFFLTLVLQRDVLIGQVFRFFTLCMSIFGIFLLLALSGFIVQAKPANKIHLELKDPVQKEKVP